MGGMMGPMMGGGDAWVWVLVWTLVGLAVVVTSGVLIARALVASRRSEPARLSAAESPSVRAARDALKLRYAHGEISREEYLQGKVELED